MRLHFMLLTTVVLSANATATEQPLLSLQEAERLALAADFALKSGKEATEAQRDVVEYVQQLPDPKFKFSVQNLPTNTLRFNQEEMTQGMVAIEQMFPPGKTLALRGEEAQAGVAESEAQVRLQERQLVQTIRNLWLDVYESQSMLRLLSKRQALYKEWLSTATATYRVGQGKQRDVVQVRILLAGLKETEGKLQGLSQTKRAELSKWLHTHSQRPLPTELPEALIALPIPSTDIQHPELEELQARAFANQTAVKIAQEAYNPAFSAEIAYGFRQDRADMVSVGVAVEIPVFREKRQDKQLAERQKRYQMSLYALQDRRAELQAQQAAKTVEARSLKGRITTYRNNILPELKQVSELAKVDYQTGRSDLSTVLMAQEAEIKTLEELLQLRVSLARAIIALRYLSGEEN